MKTLQDIQTEADKLSLEDRQGLVAHLLHSLGNMPLGADDEEALRRDQELKTHPESAVSHEEFLDFARPRRS